VKSIGHSPEKTEGFACGSNLSRSTFTVYKPGLSCGKLKRPASSVLAVRFDPVSLLVMVTVAPGRAAPLGSVTMPRTALVVSPWAQGVPRNRQVTPSTQEEEGSGATLEISLR